MLTDRDREVLAALRFHTDQGIKHSWHRKWARPLDVGGRNGSHHGATLKKLVKLGLAEAQRSGGCQRRNYRYRITAAGREALGPR